MSFFFILAIAFNSVKQNSGLNRFEPKIVDSPLPCGLNLIDYRKDSGIDMNLFIFYYHCDSASTSSGAYGAPYGYEISRGYNKLVAGCAARTISS